MKRIVLTILSMTCGLAMLLTAGCASDDDGNPAVVPPSDDITGLPWNRPLPGEAGQRFGGFPQSH